MGIATKIPQNAFEGLQLDAGVLLTQFDPAAPAVVDSAIVCATTGGISVSCVPTYSDFGEDVDNVPNNMKEFKHLDGWECTMSTTGLGTSPESIKLALGAADIDGTNTSKIVPRRDLQQTDFADLWWVGDRADGGLVACKLLNALSTGGFVLQTGKNAKGQVTLELTGHVSINAQDTMPMEFYSLDSTSAYAVVQRLTNVTSDFDGNSIASGGSATIQLTADTGHTFTNVIVLQGGVDVTSSKYSSSNHKVTLSSVSGDIEIIATANVSG